MYSSGPYLQNNLHDNIAFTGGQREFGIPRRDPGAEKE